MPPMDPAAEWLDETLRYGLVCSLVEGHRSAGKYGRFEDACVKTKLRLTRRSIEVEARGISVPLSELKCVEGPQKRPTSPIFRLAREDVFSRLSTVRWNQTGRHTQAAQHMYLVFPTRVDARNFYIGMSEVQRYGVSAMLAGACSADGVPTEPTAWQIARGRERFSSARSALAACLLRDEHSGEGDAAAGDDEVPQKDQRQPDLLGGPALLEDEDMHTRWREALAGRSVLDVDIAELRSLIARGMPLKYRHALWSKLFAKLHVDDVEALYSSAPDDVARQIEVDLPRTHAAWLSEAHRALLRRVLNAYAVRNPAVGYCQGMNFIAMVFAVLGFSEASVFAGLCYVVEEVCPGCHTRGLEGYMRDAAVLDVLAHLLLPSVHQQLDALEVPLTVIAVDHFIALLASRWPLTAVVRLWDFVLPEGSPAVFASFLALLELYLPGAAEGADVNATQADILDRFKASCVRGASEEIDRILLQAQRWLPLVPHSLIERLRCEIVSEGEAESPL